MKYFVRFFALLTVVLLSLSSCVRLENSAQDTQETNEVERIVYPPSDGRMTVMLDAGHGFRDIGCDTDLLEGSEAQVNLDIALLVKDALEKKGITVILTHDGETYPSADTITGLCREYGVEYRPEDVIENDIFSAYERAVYSAAYGKMTDIDLFLSLHVNSIEGHPEISQYELDYFADNPYSDAIGILCEDLSQNLDNKTRISADSFDNAFLVTKTGEHPSLLFEMGYATNEADCQKLNSDEWREELSRIVSDCVFRWISSFEN